MSEKANQILDRTDFCPMKQKSVKNWEGFLGDLKTPKSYYDMEERIY